MRAFALALALALVVAGCLGTDPAPEAAPDVDVLSLQANESVAGPDSAFTLEGDDGGVIHPFQVPGGSPRPPETRTFEGVFEAKDCGPFGVGFAAGQPFHNHDFTDLFQAGDIVELHVALRWTQTDSSHGDIHLFVNTPGAGNFNATGTDGMRGEIVETWYTQLLWRGDEGDTAGAGPACFFGVVVEPIRYTLEVHAAYAANAVAAQTPFLVNVPEGATRLFLTGLPTGDLPVTAHWRLFAPDDQLVGEFALNSNEAVDEALVPVSGAYVILVDHVENGFVALGTDVPPVDAEMIALDYGFNAVEIFRSDAPAPAHATVPFTLPRVPLSLFVWADAAEGEPWGLSRSLTFSVEGPRGPVMAWSQGGWVAAATPVFPLWQPLPLPGWQDISYDHHALAVGDHVASVDAENFRGSLTFFWVTYLRPGEEGQGAPEVTPGAAR